MKKKYDIVLTKVERTKEGNLLSFDADNENTSFTFEQEDNHDYKMLKKVLEIWS